MKVPNRVLKSVELLASDRPVPTGNKDFATKAEVLTWAREGIAKRAAPPPSVASQDQTVGGDPVEA